MSHGPAGPDGGFNNEIPHHDPNKLHNQFPWMACSFVPDPAHGGALNLRLDARSPDAPDRGLMQINPSYPSETPIPSRFLDAMVKAQIPPGLEALFDDAAYGELLQEIAELPDRGFIERVTPSMEGETRTTYRVVKNPDGSTQVLLDTMPYQVQLRKPANLAGRDVYEARLARVSFAQDRLNRILAEATSEGVEGTAVSAVAGPVTDFDRSIPDIAGIQEMLPISNKHQLAILMMDLNNLKWVNDNLGHAAGDAYIVAIATALKIAFYGVNSEIEEKDKSPERRLKGYSHALKAESSEFREILDRISDSQFWDAFMPNDHGYLKNMPGKEENPLRKLTEMPDSLYAIGGDEFVAFLNTNEAGVVEIFKRIEQVMQIVRNEFAQHPKLAKMLPYFGLAKGCGSTNGTTAKILTEVNGDGFSSEIIPFGHISQYIQELDDEMYRDKHEMKRQNRQPDIPNIDLKELFRYMRSLKRPVRENKGDNNHYEYHDNYFK